MCLPFNFVGGSAQFSFNNSLSWEQVSDQENTALIHSILKTALVLFFSFNSNPLFSSASLVKESWSISQFLWESCSRKTGEKVLFHVLLGSPFPLILSRQLLSPSSATYDHSLLSLDIKLFCPESLFYYLNGIQDDSANNHSTPLHHQWLCVRRSNFTSKQR